MIEQLSDIFVRALHLLNQSASLPQVLFSAQSELLEASYETFPKKSRTFSHFRVLLVFLSHFYMGFAYVLSKSLVWALQVCVISPFLALKNRFREFPTSFSYGFCLCFVKIPCLAPIGLYHKNLTITYRPSFSLPSKHFSTYVLEGFGRFFNDPLKNQSWNLQNEQNRRPQIFENHSFQLLWAIYHRSKSIGLEKLTQDKSSKP